MLDILKASIDDIGIELLEMWYHVLLKRLHPLAVGEIVNQLADGHAVEVWLLRHGDERAVVVTVGMRKEPSLYLALALVIFLVTTQDCTKIKNTNLLLTCFQHLEMSHDQSH